MGSDFKLKVGDAVNFNGLYLMEVLSINNNIAEFKMFNMHIDHILKDKKVFRIAYSPNKELN